MENIIHDILEIDLEAKKKLDEAIEKKNSIIKDASDKENEIKTSILKRAEERLKKVEDFNKGNADEAIAKINDYTKEKTESLEELYNKNHQKWEDDILNGIVGV